MKIDDLKQMSIDDLWELHEQTISTLSSMLLEQKTRLEMRLRDLAVESADKQARRHYPPVLPKFRNPDRLSETWTGRGRQPRWLSAQLKGGKRLEDFRIYI